MKDFISIDFETANEQRTSICSVGYTVVEDFQIIQSREILVKPNPFYFNSINTSIHGIEESHIINSDTFDIVWLEELKHVIEDKIVVCHNASFDISVLRHTLNYYGIPNTKLDFLCTLQLSKYLLSGLVNNKLSTVCKHFNISLNHHNAQSDSEGCAKILLQLINSAECNSISEFVERNDISFGNLNNDQYKYSSIRRRHSNNKSRVSSLETSVKISNDLEGLSFIVTGVFERYGRDEIKEVIKNHGGKVISAISGKLDFLLAGDKMGPAKKEKAEKLGVKIISEDDFRQMIGA